MDRRSNSRPLPEMGVRDPYSPHVQDLTGGVNLLRSDDLDESRRRSETLVPAGLVERSTIQDRLNYCVHLAARITETKESFMKHYDAINTNIEAATTQIISSAKFRERELKDELCRLAEEKITKWNHQLSRCTDAIRFLQTWTPDRGHPHPCGSFWNLELSEEMDFIEAGELSFHPGNYQHIVEPLQTWGKIISRRDGGVGGDGGDLGQGPMRSFIPKIVIGGTGSEPGQFCRPWGVCSDTTGRILVCDRSNHRIQIFNECGEFILQFGKEGSEPGEFNRPTGIDVDVQWRIVVADKDNHRIQIFSYTGHFLMEFGNQGTNPGEFMYPWDVATNRNCHIAVSDSKNHRVQLFSSTGSLLTYLDANKMGIENPRTGLRYLDSPRGLSFRHDGGLLVTDFNNHRVLLINETFTAWKHFGREGSKAEEFFRPQGIACDRSGKFAVADCKNQRIQMFDERGKLLMCFGSQGSGPGEFDCPQGIAFHPNRNIIVVDFNNNRIQVF